MIRRNRVRVGNIQQVIVFVLVAWARGGSDEVLIIKFWNRSLIAGSSRQCPRHHKPRFGGSARNERSVANLVLG